MALTFGDRRYREAEWTSQYTHHPKAPLSFLVGGILRQTYLYAQEHARICLMQSYGFDVQDFQADLANLRAVSAGASFVGVARGWRRVPNETSHLVATVKFALISVTRTRTTHRLLVDDGTNADAVEVSHEFDQSDPTATLGNGQLVTSQNRIAERMAEFPYTNGFAVQEVEVVLPLANVSQAAPGKCEIRLESKTLAYNTAAGTFSLNAYYQPLYAVVRADMRY